MNYNYEGYPQTQAPPIQPMMVYDRNYGYIEPHKLEKKKIRADVNRLSLTTMCMFVVSVLFGMFLGVIISALGVGLDLQNYAQSSGIPTQIFYAMQCLLVPFGTGLPFVIYMLISRRRNGNILRADKVGAGNGFLLIVAGGGLCLLANFPAQFVSQIVSSVGLDPGNSAMPAANDPFSMILYFIGVAVMPPIFEEFAFRGVILGTLRKHGDAFAIIVSSLIFGAMHMSVTSIPFAVLAGLIMGYVYVLTGNIWINVGIHFLNNALAVGMDIISANTSEIAGNIITGVLFYGFIATGLVCLVVLLYKKKLTFKLNKPLMLSSTGTKTICAITNPGFIMLMSVCLGYSVISMFGMLG